MVSVVPHKDRIDWISSRIVSSLTDDEFMEVVEMVHRGRHGGELLDSIPPHVVAAYMSYPLKRGGGD